MNNSEQIILLRSITKQQEPVRAPPCLSSSAPSSLEEKPTKKQTPHVTFPLDRAGTYRALPTLCGVIVIIPHKGHDLLPPPPNNSRSQQNPQNENRAKTNQSPHQTIQKPVSKKKRSLFGEAFLSQ
uniref:Uncharacterized protein n=1 Tax=Rhodosorus marinus TaxID=101924 RepID=A0A7S3E670_9RHOD